MNAEEARKIVGTKPDFSTEDYCRHLEASTYLAALEGPEVKAKDAEIAEANRMLHGTLKEFDEFRADTGKLYRELNAVKEQLQSERERSRALVDRLETLANAFPPNAISMGVGKALAAYRKAIGEK